MQTFEVMCVCCCSHVMYVAVSSVSGSNATVARLTLTSPLASSSSGGSTTRGSHADLLSIGRRAAWHRDFVYSFAHVFEWAGFVYAVTRQREFPASSRGSRLVTRLVRLCAGDRQFHSYTQLTLSCRSRLAPSHVAAQATAAQLASQVTVAALLSKSPDQGV